MVKLVLFDIDGTLIRSGGAGVKAFERTFATEFKIPGATDHLNFAGRTDTGLLRETFQYHGLADSPQNYARFFDSYVFWLDHLLDETGGSECPGVWSFVDRLQKLPKTPVFGLLTGNIRLGAEIKLRHFGLWELFRTGAFADDHSDRNQIAMVARKRGSALLGEELEGNEILVIGDTPHDITCANAIGAVSLAVATGGYTLEKLHPCQPTWLAQDLTLLDPAEICGFRP